MNLGQPAAPKAHGKIFVLFAFFVFFVVNQML